MNYWIGQTMGVMVAVLGISTPIFKKKWQMLAVSLLNYLLSLLSLVFLKQIGSGIFLFIVAMAQAVMDLVHSIRDTKGNAVERTIFLLLYLGLGFYGLVTGPGYVPGFNTRNIIELLPITGAVLCMCFLAARKEKTARIFFIGSNSVWALYYGIIGSTAIINSIFSIISGIFALWHHHKKA